jgi:hypothetical protein
MRRCRGGRSDPCARSQGDARESYRQDVGCPQWVTDCANIVDRRARTDPRAPPARAAIGMHPGLAQWLTGTLAGQPYRLVSKVGRCWEGIVSPRAITHRR